MTSAPYRSPKVSTTKVTVRLVDDPNVTARFQIQERGEYDKWVTLRMFSNEHEARTLFARIKEHGLGLRVLETAEVEQS